MSQPAKKTSPAPRLSVVIPAYNEELRIGATLQAVGAFLDSAPFSSEILVVDDGSTDRTVEVARSARPGIRLISNDRNRGKGYTVRHGVSEARGGIILFTDADNSTPIEEFSAFLPRFDDGADVVIGSRALPESKIELHQDLLRETAGRSFNFLLRCTTGLPFRDTQCGFKAFRRDAARKIFPRQRIEGWAFDAELITIALRHGMKVEEAPVRWINSPESRLNFWTDAPKMLLEILRLRLNDFRGRYK
jgi:dolichyl-phosphate beta-glucosyltransferase